MSVSQFFESKTAKGIFLVLIAAALVGACTPASKKRTAGTVIDDQTIEVSVINNIYATDEIDNSDHIKIEVHNGTVLLAGETRTEDNKALAARVASQVRGVKNVVNELAVMPAVGLGERLDNTYISTKANSILAAKDPISGSDINRIKVMTARRNVYLMGTVTRQEGDEVAEVIRNIGGVERVIKVFDYIDHE